LSNKARTPARAKPNGRRVVAADDLDVGRLFSEVTAAAVELSRRALDRRGLFPFGISKISVTVKVGTAEISVDVEGPHSGSASFMSEQAEATADVVFTITERVGRKARGKVIWASKGLSSSAVSGDSGHDAINIGIWKGVAFQERPGDAPYCDVSGNCWFSVFQDAYGRTDMGIHPDGGVPDATLGCIGLADSDTRPWHDALSGVNGAITCEVKEANNFKTSEDDGVVEQLPQTTRRSGSRSRRTS
jgi:hypothetical protein